MKLISLKNRIGADNRRHLSANGFSLLPLALRPRLFCWVGIISSVTMLILVGVMIVPLASNVVEATNLDPSYNDNSITVDISTAGTISLNLTPVSSDGTFAASDASSFTVSTTDENGYTVGILASDDLGKLVNTSNSDYYISSIASAANTISVKNTWGYKPSKLGSASNTDYLPAPDTNGDILNTTECANGTTNCSDAEDNYSLVIGSKVGYDLPAGTYSKTFSIVAISNGVLSREYTITYNSNSSSDTVTTMPVPSSDKVIFGDSYTVSYTVPLRDGYLFAGWCAGATQETNSTQSCPSGTSFYQSGDEIAMVTSDISLNAIWIPASEGVMIRFDGNGLFYDNEAMEMMNTVTYRATCSSTCTYAVVGGKYRTPIGYQGSWEYEGQTMSEPSSDGAGILQYLNYIDSAGNMRGMSATLYATNENTVTLVFNSSGLKFSNGNASNVVVYQWDSTNNTFVNYAGSYADPVGFNGYWKMINDGTVVTAPAEVHNEATLIYLLNNMAGSNAVGQVLYLFAENSNAAVLSFDAGGSTFEGGQTTNVVVYQWNDNASSFVNLTGYYMEPIGYTGTWDVTLGEITANDTSIDSEQTLITGLNYYKAQGVDATGGVAILVADVSATGCPTGSTCIAYDGNGATGGSMGNVVLSGNETEELMAPNYYKTGYGFAGWNTAADGTGANYGPNETVTVSNLTPTDNVVTLYAKWVASAGNLQGWSCPNNTNMPIGTVTALTDTRDNQVYAVAKLADGNCWMTENLRLDDSATTLSAGNTNQPASGFTALSASSDSWCTQYNDSSCVNQNKLNTVNTNNLSQSVSSPYGSVYAYGNYYNWYSATAGNGTYETTSGNAAGDICPAGWHLPYGYTSTGANGGGTSGGFSYLDVQLGGTGEYQYDATASNRWRSYPNNFVYSGGFYYSSASTRGGYGGYWSSTAYNSFSAYYLLFYSGYVTPGTDGSFKVYGRSVRCVLGS